MTDTQTLQEKLERKADTTNRILRNHKQTWYKPDGTPLSDLELRIPELYWQPRDWTGCGPIAYWSTIQTEDLGFDGDYSTPADQRRTDILIKAGHEKEKFNFNYHRRQLDRKTFERNLESAVKNLRKHLEHIQKSEHWLDKHNYEKDKPLFEDFESQLTEHLATPYPEKMRNITAWFFYQLCGRKEITSEQLQTYLRKMEERNPSTRFLE